MIEPVSEALLVQAAYAIGEKVVDVGCAVGWATRQLAEAVGNKGFALGLDISPELAADTAGAPGDIPHHEVSGDTLIVAFGGGYSLRRWVGRRVWKEVGSTDRTRWVETR